MSDTPRYGAIKITKIVAARNALRDAIRAEGTPRIQAAWDRLEQWIDSPPMMGQETRK